MNKLLQFFIKNIKIFIYIKKYQVFSNGYSFNQSINNLPYNLTHLTICNSFNQPIDNLPPNLIYLKIGVSFNQPINNLPSGLLYLELGSNFNHPIDNLPPNLETLILSIYFNQPIDNLPQSLKHLELSLYFNQDINNLPNTLEFIRFCSDSYYYNLNILSDNIKEIEINRLNTNLINKKDTFKNKDKIKIYGPLLKID